MVALIGPRHIRENPYIADGFRRAAAERGALRRQSGIG